VGETARRGTLHLLLNRETHLAERKLTKTQITGS
jgi:hypothetical protein